jgi:lysyl-tRNA synthetase class 2
LQHYPASQAALARLCPADLAVADRFEIFFGSLELANGYVELAAVAELEQRMRDDLDLRKAQGKQSVPVDRHLVAALNAGLPSCAGVALGFERVHMIAENTANIRDVVAFG